MDLDTKQIYLNILKRKVPIIKIGRAGNYYRILWSEVNFGESHYSFLGPEEMTYLNKLMISRYSP